MEFFRAAQQPTWPDGDENMHTYTDDRRCPQKHARQFDFLEGEWEGTLRYQQNGQWEEVPASLRAWKVLN
nr:hypothetical protein [Gammaproteobacteria bacterium]NIW46444.1 hypothetical protein [Gammaproteobacteria bacterium]NIX55721.1 hypothetical protein [candidate division Zixibacteria bacterium]